MLTPEIVMERVEKIYLASPLSLADIARRMGWEFDNARANAHTLVHNTADPHLSTLIRLAYALDTAPSRLLVEPARVSAGCRA